MRILLKFQIVRRHYTNVTSSYFDQQSSNTRAMVSIRHVLVSATCILMVTPSESWWFITPKVKDFFEKDVVKFFKEDIPQAINTVKKPLCKGFFGIACPAGLKAAAGAITVGTAGAGAGVVAGAVAGSVACSVAKDELCKRNLGDKTVFLPFSDNFDDFDKDHDGSITLKEFIEAVTSSVKLQDPQDLIEPFEHSDTNGDEILDPDEFAKSDFLFPDENDKRNMNSGGNTGVNQFSDKFADYDKNNDGYITFHEFAEVISPALNLNDPLDLLLPFSTIDKNSDGNLDQAEFVNSDFLFPNKV